MVQTNLFEENGVRRIAERKGSFCVMEFDRDVSVTEEDAMSAYFASKMNVKKRQVIAQLADSSVVVQSGAMQMMIGGVKAASNVKGAGDLLKKVVGSKMTGESAIKPKYEGNGILVLEPTYKHLVLADLSEWNGNMVIEDGMFLACEGSVSMKVVARSSISSAVLGQEGLFNMSLFGDGVVVLESPVPSSELIEVELQDDMIKIDGNMAIAWSDTLQFTVEKTTKSLVGSAASGEGLVNVYRGTGRVLIAPVE